jgi:hypothetical protein
MNGNGSTKVHAASFQVRCFSIPMENVVRADVIVKTLQKQSVLRVQEVPHAEHTHLLCKSPMEFGAAFQKMIA